MWGEKTQTGALGVDVEMQGNENVLESLRVTLAGTLSNGGYGVEQAIILWPGKVSNVGTEVHFVELLTEEV